jgi:uncharacterized protein (DUF433 family)
MHGIEGRITIEADKLNGKPVIRDQRIAVETILGYLSKGDSIDEILEHYPTLEREDIYACLKFASELMHNNYTIEPVVT